MAEAQILLGADRRFRVWDGDKVDGIYEPDEEAEAKAHLARLQRRPRGTSGGRPAPPAERELTLSAASAAARQSKGSPKSEDPSRPYVKMFANGWFVWNPITETFIGNNAAPFPTELAALDKVRELFARMRAPRASRGAQEAGPLLAPQSTKGQMGFKFNDRSRLPGATRYQAQNDGSRWEVVDTEDGAVIFSASLYTNPGAREQAEELAAEENAILAHKRGSAHRRLDAVHYYPNGRAAWRTDLAVASNRG